LGFRGGRCSIPGRVAPKKSAVWAGAELYPHYANSCFRMNKGDLKFVEVPHSVDTSLSLKDGSFAYHPDLRVDANWEKLGLDYLTIARNIVDQTMADDPTAPVIVFVAHNDVEYRDTTTRTGNNLQQCLKAIREACKEQGVQLVPATISDVVAKVATFPPESETTVLSRGAWMGLEEKEQGKGKEVA
jgi:hypothetical protein